MEVFGISYRYVPSTVEPEYKTIPEYIRYWAVHQPEKEAIVFLSGMTGRSSVTFKDVYDNSERFAKALVNLGVQCGDIVGMNIPNSPELLYAMFGAMMAGAIPITVSFTYSDGSDIVAILNKLGNCTTFVLHPGGNDQNWLTFQKVVNDFGPDGFLSSSKITSLKKLIFTSPPQGPAEVLLMTDMIREFQMQTKLPVLDPDDIAILFQTSGSTGMPKAVAHTHHSICYNLFVGALFASNNDIVYNERQFGWAGGFPYTFVQAGYTLVTRSLQSSDVIDCTDFIMKAVHEDKCTIVLALPPVLRELIQRKDEIGTDWNLHKILSGGQPLSKFYADCIGVLCKRFGNAYGSTEALFCFENDCNDLESYEEYACGQPYKGVEVKFVDDDGRVLPVNTKGELWIRSPSLFLCYYNDPEKTKKVKTPTGWYKTDDVGYMTETGTFVIEGRKSDLILSGGLNVAPSILESSLRAIEGIRDAFIVPIPHPALFQVLCACMVKMDEATLTEKDVEEYIERIHLDKPRAFTVLPVHYLFFDDFPQTSTGKVSRKKLAVEANKRLQVLN